MSPAFKKYLDPASYMHRWKKLQRSRRVSRLEKSRLMYAEFTPLWQAGTGPEARTGKKDAGFKDVFVDAFIFFLVS